MTASKFGVLPGWVGQWTPPLIWRSRDPEKAGRQVPATEGTPPFRMVEKRKGARGRPLSRPLDSYREGTTIVA